MSDGYEFEAPGLGVKFEASRLRRERGELTGELSVQCDLPGAQTINGYLITGDFNFSSVRARQERAKVLSGRARTNGDMDWFGLLEDFCQRVFIAERQGDPASDLRKLPRPEPDDVLKVEGLIFPRRHPSILFGDGGSAKSYLSLFVLGTLAASGLKVALFDWELSGEDHRDRLERLFGSDMPEIQYCRCERPLIHEADRLRRIVKEHRIDFAVYDSVAFACDGPPEAAEIAGKYFRAVREINCGSLHIAHINKSENSDQRPFGSAFWHNGARMTWNVQSIPAAVDRALHLGFYNRKANLGPLLPAVGLRIMFLPQRRTVIICENIGDTEELAAKLSVKDRIVRILRETGPQNISDLCELVNPDNPDSVRRQIDRSREFLRQGSRVYLQENAS